MVRKKPQNAVLSSEAPRFYQQNLPPSTLTSAKNQLKLPRLQRVIDLVNSFVDALGLAA
jgi:hypothetical protein